MHCVERSVAHDKGDAVRVNAILCASRPLSPGDAASIWSSRPIARSARPEMSTDLSHVCHVRWTFPTTYCGKIVTTAPQDQVIHCSQALEEFEAHRRYDPHLSNEQILTHLINDQTRKQCAAGVVFGKKNNA